MGRQSTSKPTGHRSRPNRSLPAVVLVVSACLATFASPTAAVSGRPAPPRHVEVRSVSQTSIGLSWMPSPNPGPVIRYRIYVNAALRASVRTTSYRVGGLRCGTSYVVAVDAYDADRGSSIRWARRLNTQRCADDRARPRPPEAAKCSKTIGAETGLAPAIVSARAGSVVCLRSGTYSGFTLSNVSKASDVTLQPAPGATVTFNSSVALHHDTHIRVSGLGGTMSIAGINVDDAGGCEYHVTVDHVVFTAPGQTSSGCTNSDVLFDHDSWDNLGTGSSEGRFTIYGSHSSAGPVGITVSNSHFGGEGPGGTCSDGVEVLGAYGVQIGPGNEFTGIYQNGCTNGAHADPIGYSEAPHLLVIGNYFHDNGDGSGGMLGDTNETDFGVVGGSVITQNVFVCSGYPYSILGYGAKGFTITHNTFAGGGLVRFEEEDRSKPSGNLVRDNVFAPGGGISLSAASAGYGTNDHNLNAGQPGTADIRGTPVFVGGKKPTSYAGFVLAAGSPGKEAASHGGDMGISGDG